MNNNTLILVPLNFDHRDLSGVLFPDRGYIKSELFKNDSDILLGILGSKWGFSAHCLPHFSDDLFAVVKVDGNIVELDYERDCSLVKFKEGYVIFSGTEKECLALIQKDENYPKVSIEDETSSRSS